VIEAGFPATQSDSEEVANVAKSVGTSTYVRRKWGHSTDIYEVYTPAIAGLSRTTPSDIEATWASIENADFPRIHTFVSTDDKHMKAKFPGKSKEEVLQMGVDAIRQARRLSNAHQGASIEFSAEAASTTDAEYLEKIVKKVVEEGVDVINVPDTVGQRNPHWMYEFYTRVINWATSINPEVIISAHNHQDLGNATANSFELVHSAADIALARNIEVNIQIEATVCGLGERAGNTDIFPFIANIFKFAEELPVGVLWQFNPESSVAVADSVMKFAGLETPRQSPIVGSDTNVHRSGIHSDGVLKGGHEIYSAISPTFWGHKEDAIHEDGKYQGSTGREAALH